MRIGAYYSALVSQAGFYYPFGWEIPTLQYSSGYRYGFNGKENDSETKSQDYGFRVYFPRETIFGSVDPIASQYPELSPYRFAGNTPIWAVDLDGLEPHHLSETEYRKHATATFQYEQHYDGQTHKIDMMQVDGDWIFSRPEGDKEQWYYLNKKQEWEKFSNDRNYADGVRETVDNIVIAGGATALITTSVVLPITGTARMLGFGGAAAWAKNITKVPSAKSATSLSKTSPIVNASKAETGVGSSLKNASSNGAENLAGSVANNRLHHIFGKSEHALESLVTKFGSQEGAYSAVQNAANQSLQAGRLTPNAKGVLPSGDLGNIINVGGMNVRLIGGKIENGRVILSSFSRKGLE